jgi:GTPase SAR1 family protein
MKFEDGLIATPFFIIIYGAPGVGKSSFCSHAPDPIYLDVEEGTKKINVKRLSGFSNYQEFIDLIDQAVEGRRFKQFQTIIIDTIDFLEQMIFDYVCKKKGKKTIGDFSHGAGYRFVLDEWLELLNKLSLIRKGIPENKDLNQEEVKGKNIILIAHEQIKRFENPISDSYDRYSIKLYDKATSFIIAKCDAVFFISRSFVLNEDKTDKNRKIAVKLPGRTIYTEETPSIIAKNRYGLSPEVRISEKEEDAKRFFENLF